MFLTEAIRSRIASSLHPWLQEEPDLELKLGFLRSHGTAKNLIFNVSALNQLLDGKATRFCFTHVRVENIVIRVSPWSIPAFTVEVRALDVAVAARELEDSKRRRSSADLVVKEMKEMLAVLDPEGSYLHETLERISDITSGNRLMNGLTNVVLKHFQLIIHDIHLQLQMPDADESIACFLNVNKLSVRALHLDFSCLLKGLVHTLFVPQEESSLVVNGNNVEIGLKRKEFFSCIASSEELFTCIQLRNFQLVDFAIHSARVKFSFSPCELPVLLLASDLLASREAEGARNGRELWKIALHRIGYLSPNYKSSLGKIVKIAVMWLSLVRAYESLLLLVGYSDEKIFKVAVARMRQDRKFLSLVRLQLKLVSDIERDLPIEGVSQARRIARYRVALNLQQKNLKTVTNFDTNFFWKILLRLSFLWNFIYSIFRSILHSLFSLWSCLDRQPETDRPASDTSFSNQCFSVNLGEISVAVSPVSAIFPAERGAELDGYLSQLNFLSFCLVINALCLTYLDDNSVQSLSLACGDFKIHSFSSTVSLMGFNSKVNAHHSFQGLRHATDKDLKEIVWSAPALQFQPSKKVLDSMNFTDNAWILILESYLGELCSNWKGHSKKFEGNKIQDLEQPFLLCEIKSFLMDPYINMASCGLFKCSLTVGRLSFELEYLAIVSAALLLKQINDACCWTANGGMPVRLHSSSINEELAHAKWEDHYESFANWLKMTALTIFPEKNIQVGIAIAGPHFRISMQGEGFPSAKKQDNNHIVAQSRYNCFFTIDVENIEIAVWPTSKTVLASLIGEPRLNEAAAEHLWLKEPQFVGILNADVGKSCDCQGRIGLDTYLRFNGLHVFLEDSEGSQQSQVIELMAVIIQSSSSREYVHSFTTNRTALSAAVSGTATGSIVCSYINELHSLFQFVEGILSTVSHAFVSLDSSSNVIFQDFIWKDMASTRKAININMLASKQKCLNLILKSMTFIIDASLEIKSVDIILHRYRERAIIENHINLHGASSSVAGNWDMAMTPNKAILGVPDFGIGVSVQQCSGQISWQEAVIEVHFDVSGIQSSIFRYQSQFGKCTDMSRVKNLPNQSFHCLYDFSISTCAFSICAALQGNSLSTVRSSSEIGGSTSDGCKTSYEDEAELTNAGERSGFQSCENQNLRRDQLLTTSIMDPASSCWFLVNFILADTIIAENAMKNILIGAHQSNALQYSVSIDRDLHEVSCEIQGGPVVLETKALATFVHCFKAYLLFLNDLSSCISPVNQSEGVQPPIVLGKNGATSSSHHTEEHVHVAISSASTSETSNLSSGTKWRLPEILSITVSNFCLAFAATDESDKAWELLIEVDFHVKLELVNSRRKSSLEISRLTIFSQHPIGGLDQTMTDFPASQFSSGTSNGSSFCSGSGHHALPSQVTESKCWQLDNACDTRPQISQEKFSKDGGEAGSHTSNHSSYILKHLFAFIVAEKALLGGEVSPLNLQSDWIGSGSFSGLDLTVTLSEIEMLFVLIAPLSEISNMETIPDLAQKFGSGNQGVRDSPEDSIPDGAIVALKDLHQHLYLAVEAVENKFQLVGSIHYSLAGQRSLFRVSYHKRRRWSSTHSWFSLISLHARNDKGEPLRLNCRSGSDFVDISSTNDRGWALWQTSCYKPGSCVGDSDLEFSTGSATKAFYLVNQKNNSGIAFVDGLPEFVKKPGNPFKVKVFRDFSPTREVVSSDVSMNYGGICETSGTAQLRVDNQGTSLLTNTLPHIIITFDKVTLTILHEVSDGNDKFPLLRGSIDNLQFIIQILSCKTRVISKLTPGVYYFVARRNCWEELICPIEVCLFYHSRFRLQDVGVSQQGLPAHFYLWMRKVDIFLTELSLDILLFLAGKMNLAGPYAVRSSNIFANCWKVENDSGMTLLCHFGDSQDAVIDRKQSSSIFLRDVAQGNQLPDGSSVSLQLTAPGAFSTSPIHLSLSRSQVLAWRTRVVSLQDSRTFPGPFVVVDISKKKEDEMSLSVSPLLRIHNESGFSMELCFRRPQEPEAESALVSLRNGDTVDDSMAVLDALNLSGGPKKALISLTVGNFLLSVRPQITEYFKSLGKLVSIDWSEDLKGGKAFRLSGIIDKLNYRFKRAFAGDSVKSSFSTVHCSINADHVHVTDLHFLIQTIRRDVPVMQPHKSEIKTSPVALQEQKEIFLLPTVQVYNLLQSEIVVLLTENEPDMSMNKGCDQIGKQAIIPSGSSAYLYANPSIIYFTVTLTTLNSKCKPVNSGDLVKKLSKQKTDVHNLDIELDFGGGKYFASLRLSRKDRGILEATVFTSYTLQNDTDLSLFCFTLNQKPLSRQEADKHGSNLPPELGYLLPPKSTKSWFLKSNKVYLKRLEDKASVSLLDLDLLSGFTELYLEVENDSGMKHIAKLGVSMKPCFPNIVVPSQMVSMVPRYVICNEAGEDIIVCQCYLEDDMEGIVAIHSNQKAALYLRTDVCKKREISFIDSMLRKHRNLNEDSLIFVRFCLKEIGWSWSGPICIASLGRFFLKFKKPSDSLGYESRPISGMEDKLTRYAEVRVVEEDSTLVLHFHMPPNSTLPYRIENCLSDASITYYQKDLVNPETLASGNSIAYVWDDVTLPHKLVIQIADMHLSREINIDKVCPWKPLFKIRQSRGLALQFPFDKKYRDERRNYDETHGMEMLKVGYEVYADGPTRVLRICKCADDGKDHKLTEPYMKIQFRISYFSLHMLENANQDVDETESSVHSTIVVARLENISLDSTFTNDYKANQIRVQSLNIDEKWQGAPFAAMLRRHQQDYDDINENILYVVFILCPANSNVKQVKHSSILLQPIDFNLDEETLMRLVPFWRTSLADSNTQSQQFYFNHFEIHPIKIIASFIPGNPNSSYTSAQETLRSLLHSVIKVPAVKNMVVELNGVLLTHAMLTTRELVIKCAQHYSWYAMRAVYIAKGSPLLPPAFTSIFDDSASSSLDVFFDPSSGLVNVPGLTLGTFKFINKCINGKGFSGTKRYFGDLGKTMKTAGSNILFAAVTEISDCVLKGAEASGFNGMVSGFHQGILKLAMEPSLLGNAVLEGGPDRKIKLDRSPGVDELYVEGYLQAMLDVMYKQDYLRVRVIDDQVILKNLPPNSSIINEIMEHVKSFLVTKGLTKGEASAIARPLRHLRGETEWKIGPTVLTLCEHLFVSFAIRMLRKQTSNLITSIKQKGKSKGKDKGGDIILVSSKEKEEKFSWKSGIGKFVVSGLVAYIDGRLCRCIPNAIARRIVSGFLLSFLDKESKE